jgi:hypothetical protein
MCLAEIFHGFVIQNRRSRAAFKTSVQARGAEDHLKMMALRAVLEMSPDADVLRAMVGFGLVVKAENSNES